MVSDKARAKAANAKAVRARKAEAKAHADWLRTVDNPNHLTTAQVKAAYAEAARKIKLAKSNALANTLAKAKVVWLILGILITLSIIYLFLPVFYLTLLKCFSITNLIFMLNIL